ncbi:apoptosis regulatory protein Siva [Battus philenor]|uniref:apoptosis regulatory protein Siva n=1 Tax=Battus philenor TaxID=42288 RepID=UPI0035CEDF1E
MATKRSNPFIEDFMPQSKVHVGLKQFNNNEDRLRKVYEKTLELLFRGAKKSSCQNNASNQEVSVVNNRDGMKQLVIGKDGSLLNEEAKVQDKACAVTHCSCGAAVEVFCNYCERALCNSCQQFCTRCQMYHCSHCSLIGSEGAEICVSCYG